MKKILFLIMGLCFAFALIGCGGDSSSNSDPYKGYENYKPFEKNVPAEYMTGDEESMYSADGMIMDGEFIVRHVWKGEYLSSPYGKAKKITVVQPGSDSEYYGYLKSGNCVYYGFENEGNFEFCKMFDGSKINVGDTWQGAEGLKCEIVAVDSFFRIYSVKITETETGAALIYDYSEVFGMIYGMQESKMKIILIKDPKFLNPILRLIYKIKKKKN